MKHPMPIFLRAECRAAPKPAARWRESSTGRFTSALAPWGLSPDTNSPGDCLCLAKGWASWPSAACKAGRRTRRTRGSNE